MCRLVTHLGIQNAGHYVSDKLHGHSSQASKEVNKDVAKDSHAPLESRAAAAKDAVTDKAGEAGHKSKAEAHKGEGVSMDTVGHADVDAEAAKH